MNLRKRLLLISTLIFGLVFALSAFLIYSGFLRSSEQIIYKEMNSTALLTAYFYLEEDEMTGSEHRKIRQEFMEKMGTSNSKVKLYDGQNNFVFGDKDTGKGRFLNNQILDKTRKLGKLEFKEDNTYFYGLHYPDNQGDFVVFVISENEFFQSQINKLVGILLLSLFGGLILIFLLSYYLSNFAYQPIRKMVGEIEKLKFKSSEKSFLSVPETNDEFQKLALKFNELFERLSESFSVQKNFINYLSHEIKTPLASISGNLEVFGQKDRSPDEYRKVSRTAVNNVYEIENIINNLQTLTELEDKKPSYSNFRLDEALWPVLEKINQFFPKAQELIKLDFRVSNPELLNIKGNKKQIEIVLYNLIENAVKYSDDKEIKISVFEQNGKLQIQIIDNGRGIPDSEMSNILQPFFRGSNVERVKGSGIGLPLAYLILKQHRIKFEINSRTGNGTMINLEFPVS